MNRHARILWRSWNFPQTHPPVERDFAVWIIGHVAQKDLMDAIWPNTFVEDGNLNFNVSMLRKALGTDEAGEQYIQTIPRHGYRFSADVREVTEEVPALVVERHSSARLMIEEREPAARDGETAPPLTK